MFFIGETAPVERLSLAKVQTEVAQLRQKVVKTELREGRSIM
jgi:hypothetical protein